MKKQHKLFLTTLVALVLSMCVIGALPSSAADGWSWANYGFSGTAIANPDPFEKTSYLIGGYVATINHLNPLPHSYEYRASIILDTEGVAVRFRFSWVNTEPGYKAVADLSDGIAIYPMDESLDIAIVTDSGTRRISFPVPAAYDYMAANEFLVQDDGNAMAVMLCGKTIATLKFTGTRTVAGKNCYESITVTDGNGYVYDRLQDTLVLSEGGYCGYSSQTDRALILVKSHVLSEAVIDFGAFPEEKETTEGWVPETEARESETLPETETGTETTVESESTANLETPNESELETLPATESETKPVSAPESATEAVEDTSAQVSEGGCQSLLCFGAPAVLGLIACTWTIRKKEEV